MNLSNEAPRSRGRSALAAAALCLGAVACQQSDSTETPVAQQAALAVVAAGEGQGPTAPQPPGPRPSEVLAGAQAKMPALAAAADVKAFVDFAAQAGAGRREEIRQALQRAAVLGDVSEALVKEVRESQNSDHSRALVALSLLGEQRSPVGTRFLMGFVKEPLPDKGTLVEGEIVEQTDQAILQAKAVAGLAYAGQEEADRAVLEMAGRHRHRVVRAEAIRTYLFNKKFSSEAVRLLSSVVRKDELIFLERPYRIAGETAQSFDARLTRFLDKHPELAPPKPELSKGSGPVLEPGNPPPPRF